MTVTKDDLQQHEVTPLEVTPLLGAPSTGKKTTSPPSSSSPPDARTSLFLFLEAQTPAGLKYEKFTIVLIFLSVASFILSSLFIPTYYPSFPLKCGSLCDALWFGNDPDNDLSFLNIGGTSVLEIFIVGVFTIDYLLRIYTADLIDEKYKGLLGRIRFLPTFFSLVDLASTVPFYIDAFFLPNTDLAASNFLRMFRLLRMMRMEGRYDLALGLLDDVFIAQKEILGTALFLGCTVWSVVSSCYYIAERRNTDMIYCDEAPERCFEDQDEIDTSLCVFDEWGVVDCSAAGCASEEGEEACYSLFRSIVDSSFWALVNLFGEFPLVDQHSVAGKVVGTLTAVLAVVVFALPSGVIAAGLVDQLSQRRAATAAAPPPANNDAEDPQEDQDWDVVDASVGNEFTFRGTVYNFLFRQDTILSLWFERFVNFLVIGTSLTFMFDTLGSQLSDGTHAFFEIFEFLSVLVFTAEYVLKMYSVVEDPQYKSVYSRIKYALSFLPLVDLLSFLPYWINLLFTHQIITPVGYTPFGETLVKCFRFLRILRFEKYIGAFTVFDELLGENLDILAVTGFSALLLWIFFSAILYLTERDNPNEEMANYYKTVPHAMWITLLNLSGECPLGFYSLWGKIVIGLIGLFASGVFGIPIAVLGDAFSTFIEDTVEDTPDEVEDEGGVETAVGNDGIQKACYNFVNGVGSTVALAFESMIYLLIIITVAVGVIQTVPGQENTFSQMEWFAVIVFTVEYIIRFVGVGADPEFAGGTGCCDGVVARMKFIVSYYSIIDLLAILPFYLSIAMPGSWVDQNDEYMRMLRLLRLIKLDKYFPSISLIDDVIRLKKNALKITCYAAGTLWIIFAGVLYLAEYHDTSMEIDEVPLYGCDEDCTMSDRFQNYFASFVYTGVHLTGDYPITEYDWFGRIICFFMVIAAVGVVSIPSGILADGFVTIVDSKASSDSEPKDGRKLDDDWYEIRFRELEGKEPPKSRFGPKMDHYQEVVHAYLFGEVAKDGTTIWTPFSKFGRIFFFLLIATNVFAVIVESIPEIDKFIGNDPGNFFDVFETFSVAFFTLEYILHLFSAPKTREALYSPWVYALTFFGIVDLISIAPWYISKILVLTGYLDPNSDAAMIFRIFRIFRILQFEDFIVAWSKLDNVFRASKEVLKATVLMAVIIWVGCGALFFIFEKDNPNWRSCDDSIPLRQSEDGEPGCYDFSSTAACNDYYPGMCNQDTFTSMPDALFYVAVFLDGEWGVIDFNIVGRLVCMFLCVAGIGLYSIPTGILIDNFGSILGMSEDD